MGLVLKHGNIQSWIYVEKEQYNKKEEHKSEGYTLRGI